MPRLWDALLPGRCFGCGSNPEPRSGGICGRCWSQLPERSAFRCGRCDRALPEITDAAVQATCGRCLAEPPGFARLEAAVLYRGVARSAVLAFKFAGADYLASHLARVMAERLQEPAGASRVVAIPSTRRRLRQRGYNPAELLARSLAARLRLPYDGRALRKTRETEIQSLLPLAERATNVRAAFRARPQRSERFLLVDDVATSGATASSAAHALRKAGASEVVVWAFARALPGEDG